MDKEQEFWNRFIELAQSSLSNSVYELLVEEARLIELQDGVATIFLAGTSDSILASKKKLWKQNIEELILIAGLEVLGEQISVTYHTYQSVSEPKSDKAYKADKVVTTPAEADTPAPIGKPSKSSFLPIQSGIQPQYTFDNFVQGGSNMMAKSAALAVAHSPGQLYNPLFIWGGPGLGKTHLLNGIGNQVLGDNPHARVQYVTSESFLNEFVNYLTKKELDMEEFKEHYRNLDLLLIDDIQLLKGKASTQEEFFHTFDALLSQGKQIVLTSDRNPDSLDNLEDRLVSRFSWGATCQIYPPDIETREAILRTKCATYPFEFPNDTLTYLAGQIQSNVRNLEGILKDISLLAGMRNLTTITVDIAAEAIRGRNQAAPKNSVIPIETIQTEVGKFYGVSLKEIKGSKRLQNIVLARQVAMYLAREMTDNSLPKIGKAFGNRDHTTVMHAYKKIRDMLKNNESFLIEITNIKNKIM
ncbi:chromosomal replication initiator protein DnaA [Streptococcus sp. P25B114]|uniref:chromosomal replication initiator protein DnaA n=1 Tax=Streptococcus TaxID=1301 RepID=UPI000CF4B2A4|nr:chromosomal replication initiator protein DnaA [Streptococcus suis]